MQEFLTAINTVGFPIVCCIVLFYQNKQISAAINNNTNVIAKLESKIDTLVELRTDGEKHNET